MTNSHDTTPANPIPPGWPDPIESPQAEAIRNGKLDDTEIRNLFDCMERELRLHRERAANPAQGVSEADLRERLVEAEAIIAERNDELALIDWISNKIGLPHDKELTRENFSQYLTAAIGAGGQAVAVKPLDLSNLLKHAFSAGYVSAAGDDGWTDYDPTKCAAYSRVLSAIAHPVQPGWRDIAEDQPAPPHDTPVLLWSPPSLSRPNGEYEARPFSTGRSGPGWSEYSQHSWATHWMPLPAAPQPKGE